MYAFCVHVENAQLSSIILLFFFRKQNKITKQHHEGNLLQANQI